MPQPTTDRSAPGGFGEGADPGLPGLELAQATLEAQPFSRLVGARLVQFGAGQATIEIPIRDELTQHLGLVHGGVLAFAVDNALTFAAGALTGPAIVTAGFSIEYLRPAHGVALRATASVVRAGRTRVVARCDVTTVDGDGTVSLCAVAHGAASPVGAAGREEATSTTSVEEPPGTRHG